MFPAPASRKKCIRHPGARRPMAVEPRLLPTKANQENPGSARASCWKAASIAASGAAPCAGKQVGHRRAGNSQETALGMGLRDQPVGHALVHGKTRWRMSVTAPAVAFVAPMRAPAIAPCAVGRFEVLQTLNQLEWMRRCLPKVLVSAKRHESSIGCAVRQFHVAFVTAVVFAKLFDPRQQCPVKSGWHSIEADDRPTAASAETCTKSSPSPSPNVRRKVSAFQRAPRHRAPAFRQRENCVVKIRSPGAISPAAFRRQLTAEKIADGIGGVPNNRGARRATWSS